MKLDIYQVDAFTSKVFGGNPAAVVPLNDWLPDDTLLKIAIENNLSETAFFIPHEKGYALRWFTPGGEVKLCGHATLATAFVVFEFLAAGKNAVTFESKSGQLFVAKTNDGLTMDFPIWPREAMEIPDIITKALGKKPVEFYNGNDLMAVYESPNDIHVMKPDFRALSELKTRGVIVTAPGDGKYDFISRGFFPALNIDEDPVTGSAHCMLAPYWAERLGKTKLSAHQASERTGDIFCELKGDRVELSGQAALYMRGEIYV